MKRHRRKKGIHFTGKVVFILHNDRSIEPNLLLRETLRKVLNILRLRFFPDHCGLRVSSDENIKKGKLSIFEIILSTGQFWSLHVDLYLSHHKLHNLTCKIVLLVGIYSFPSRFDTHLLLVIKEQISKHQRDV